MNVRWRSQFKKDYKRMMKQGKDIGKLDYVIEELAVPNSLPEQCRDHYLVGNWSGYKECHIEPNWLLIYDYETLDDGEKQLLLWLWIWDFAQAFQYLMKKCPMLRICSNLYIHWRVTLLKINSFISMCLLCCIDIFLYLVIYSQK